LLDVETLSIISRVAAHFVASSTLAKGDLLEVWMKRGSWWTEMRRGTTLEVKDVNGDTLTINHYGWATSGWTMKLPPGQNLDGKFTLEGVGQFKRSLVVLKK
jgi:hypothetical protein